MTQARTIADFVSGTTTITGNPTFSGTVAGAGSMELISTLTYSTPAATIDYDNLSTDYDSLQFYFNMHSSTDGVRFFCRFLDSSGAQITAANSYGFCTTTDNSVSSADDDNLMALTASTIGSDTHEGARGTLNLLGRNYVVATDSVPPTICGFIQGHYQSNVYSGGPFYGGLNSSSVQTIRGIRFGVSSGNIEKAKIHLFGVRCT
jgi:hypothetical protein